MAKTVSVKDLGAAIEQELILYHRDVVEAVDQLSKNAVKDLVSKTKATAPVRSGGFKRSIASKQIKKSKTGSVYAWYVKSPDYRRTHLLVHGHATRDGGRTKANPFLENAVAEVIPNYQEQVEEMLKNGK